MEDPSSGFEPHDLDSLTLSVNKDHVAAYVPHHPNAWKHSKRVYLHRLVMENELGRYLDSGEHVHHVDGNPRNNSPGNLELVSHATHNQAHNASKYRDCPVCGRKFRIHKKRRKHCSPACAAIGMRKVEWPSRARLRQLVWSMSKAKVGQMYGVSESAVRKWVKRYGIHCPLAGYFSKRENRR